MLTVVCAQSFAQSGVLNPSIPEEAIHTADLSVAGASPSGDSKKYTLTGSVINSQTGEGVLRALVEVNGQFQTLTDSDGNFKFEGLAEGRYFFSARKPGYFNPQDRISPATIANTVIVGRMTVADAAVIAADAQPLTIKLIPEALISGRITDSDGLPVQRLPVHCLRSTVVEGRRQWVPAGSASTDEDGEYRIASLMPGMYRLAAGPSQIPAIGAMAKTGKQLAGYGAAYYPASDDASTGGMRITAGQKLVIDLSADAEPFYSVSGTFNVPPGFSVGMSLVPRDPGREQSGGMMMRRDSNSFSMRMVPKGDYMLQASAHADNKNWFSYVPLHVASDISDLQIALQPGITIPVSVTKEQTQSTLATTATTATEFRINGARMPLPLQVTLRPVDQSRQQQFMAMRPDDPSAFAIDNVAPGTYKAVLFPFGDFYVASARYGNVDLLRENLTISQSSADTIEIVLRDDGGKIKASIISDGKPSNGTLLIVPEHGTPYAPRNQMRSGQGMALVSLQQLAPGSYSILAFDSLDDLEYSNPDALDAFMSRAAHVDVSAGQETSVAVELIKRGSEWGSE
jgi:protocatechuate 3,4-dioxygenase beta subunit